MGEINGEPCKRKVIQINKENYYLVVGGSFVFATIPRENAPDQSKEREIVETLCEAITELMEGSDDSKTTGAMQQAGMQEHHT